MRLVVTLFLLLSFGLLQAQPGPPVGAKVPDFDLVDQNGQRHTLSSLMGPKGLMLVFFRSADW